MRKTATVFEHGRLKIGEQGFTESKFDALVRYNERHECKFFDVGYQCIQFKNYVGVIQVGGFTIEILPKTDKSATGDEAKWRNALITMLRRAGIINIYSAPEADLHLNRSSFIDFYLALFLSEVEKIEHAGLVKKYHKVKENLHALKGRILFSQQINRNLIHQERVYTEHETYDRDNVYNRILKRAVEIVSHIALNSSLAMRSKLLELAFEDITNTLITAETFDRAVMTRHTEAYRMALQLARLIILNYSPDMRSGDENILAILFDMNKLFEKFIFIQLRRAAMHRAQGSVQVNGQVSKPFWGGKSIRPDIVIENEEKGKEERIILDTKWKIPDNSIPSDADLQQIYTYNLHFGSKRGILIYPSADSDESRLIGRQYESAAALPEYQHGCAVYCVNLFDEKNNLKKGIGDEMLNEILSDSNE